MKIKVLWGFVALFIVAGVCVYSLSADKTVESYPRKSDQFAYYQKLNKQCRLTPNVGCCMASVRSMQATHSVAIADGQCPEGFSRNMLKCPTSYQWCTLVKETVSEEKKQ